MTLSSTPFHLEAVAMRHIVQRLFVAVSLAALVSTPALAQNTITLEGSVKGEGAPLADARVTVVNIATLETARALTRRNGDFRIIGLFTGQYVVTVRALGFRPASDTVQLVIGQRARLEYDLPKGAANALSSHANEERAGRQPAAEERTL